MRPWHRPKANGPTPEQEILARWLRQEKEAALAERSPRSVQDRDGTIVAFIEIDFVQEGRTRSGEPILTPVAFVHLTAAGHSRVCRPWNE